MLENVRRKIHRIWAMLVHRTLQYVQIIASRLLEQNVHNNLANILKITQTVWKIEVDETWHLGQKQSRKT